MTNYKLDAHATISKAEGPVLVCILDGYGENEYQDDFNAVKMANTPCFDSLRANKDRFRTVQAHGTAVGLPTDADMGNSEVGHNALGSGQVVDQGARLVDIALDDGSLFTSDGWKHIEPAFESGTLHLIGLASNGGVHSRLDQLYGIIKGAIKAGARRVRVHTLTDGRDVQDGSSVKFVAEVRDFCKEVSVDGVDARIASGGGRMYVTMDRYEADWDIVKRGWEAHVLGEAPNKFECPVEAIQALRAKSGDPEKPVSDQHLEPFVVVDGDGAPVGTVEDGDAVVIFNFRADRVVELSKAFEYEDFSHFDRKRYPKVRFSGIMQYDGDLKLPANFLVPPPVISRVSGHYLAGSGISTFAVSETQKFGHVTFFWNGNRSGYINGDLETYLEIPSDKVVFNEKPAMKAREITEAAKEALLSGKYKMVRVNYANPDMVGHTGDLQATISACETVDACLKELLEAADGVNARWLVTSDHGNADDMVQRTKKGEPIYDEGRAVPLTSHTLAPVGVAIGGKGLPASIKIKDEEALPKAGLANITATFIELLGLKAPDFYEPSLLSC